MSLLRHLSPGERRILYAWLAPQCCWHTRELAERLEISVRQLETYFMQDLETTPRRWLMQRRLEEAKRLLLRLRSVKDVAERLGYSDVGNFYRDWRRFHRGTPGQFLRHQTVTKDFAK
jgi:AraC-like DNA-binding protein